MSEFKLGDRVTAFGEIGTVIELNEGDAFPVGVKFRQERFSRFEYFTKDGKYSKNQAPILVKLNNIQFYLSEI